MIILSSSHLTCNFGIQLVQTESHQIDNISNELIFNIELIPLGFQQIKARVQTKIKSPTTTDLRISLILCVLVINFNPQYPYFSYVAHT